MYTVYSLSDPETDEIRYIGMTANTLERRLKWHFHSPHSLELAEWFASLQRKDLKPRMGDIVSEIMGHNDACAIEAKYIKQYASKRLLNYKGNGKKSVRKARWTVKVTLPEDTGERLYRYAREEAISLDRLCAMLLTGFKPEGFDD